MPTWGITPAGFAAKPYSAILADYQASWLANVSATADLSVTSPEGQILGILANNDAELWELLQAAWNAYNREDVEGAGLDNLGDLQGALREGPSYTQVVATLTLAAGTYLAGTLVASVVGTPTLTFSNLHDVVSLGGANTVLMQAQTLGPTPTINAGTLTQIATPVSGWTAVTNPAAQSQTGASSESDAAYVVRQLQELSAGGANNPSATISALVAFGAAQVPAFAVTAEVLENSSDWPVVFGSLTLPPHSYAPIVYEPTGVFTAAEIGTIIYANKPPGISSYGTTAVTIVDKILGNVLVYYTPPAPVPIYVTVTVVLRAGYSLATVTAAIQAALVAAAIAPTPVDGAPPPGQLLPGAPVIGSQLVGICMEVAGVYDVQSLTFGVTPTPMNTAPLAMSPTQVATIAASTVATNVVVVQGTGL